MTEESTENKPKKKRNDRLVKIGFVAAAAVAVLLVWLLQRSAPELPGWRDDFQAALAEAKTGNRPLVVLFISDPPSETARRLIRGPLRRPENIKALEKIKAVRVVKNLPTDLDGNEIAEKYKVTELPTTILLGPDGAEKNRRTGYIGELDFRNGFLDEAKIVKPE